MLFKKYLEMIFVTQQQQQHCKTTKTKGEDSSKVATVQVPLIDFQLQLPRSLRKTFFSSSDCIATVSGLVSDEGYLLLLCCDLHYKSVTSVS